MDELVPAFLLHRRAYRETSALIDVFAYGYGRFSLIAKGIKRGRNNKQALLQAFSPLLITWRGRGELQTLTQLEANGAMLRLQGDALMSGFYMNELLMRLLHKHDPHPELFEAYQHTLTCLHHGEDLEIQLRLFELCLLEAVGYGFSVDHVKADAVYLFTLENGFMMASADVKGLAIFRGADLLAIAQRDFSDQRALTAAKKVMRTVFQTLLHHKPLKSRELFVVE